MYSNFKHLLYYLRIFIQCEFLHINFRALLKVVDKDSIHSIELSNIS